MSEISEAIQEKCLAFSDRIIRLNDYLLEQASQKYDGGSKRYDVRKGKSSFNHQTSNISQGSDRRYNERQGYENRFRSCKDKIRKSWKSLTFN